MGHSTCIRVFADQQQINRCKEKIKFHSDDLTNLSQVFNLAGNAVHLKMLFLLHEEDELCVCDLSDILEMKISAVSQHLRKLKDSNIVRSKKVGQTVFYSVSPDHAQLLQMFFELITNNKKLEQVN